MSTELVASVEARLAALESEVRTIKSRIGSATDWISKIDGSMVEMPDFDKVLEFGSSIRRHQTAADDC